MVTTSAVPLTISGRTDAHPETAVTLGDSTAALRYFESCGLGSNVDERYIRLYGTLQAVILQQDAIKAIYGIYFDCETQILPGWKECRRLRNLATGHPVDADYGKLRVFLSWTTITDNGFDLLIFQSKNPDHAVKKTIDFRTPYNSYKEEALALLKEIQAKQKALAATL